MYTTITVTVGAVVFWAALSVVSRALLLQFNMDPWLFTFIQLTVGGLTLLLIGGRQTLSTSSFQKPQTWVLGVLRVLSAAFYTSMLAKISVLETGSLGTLSVPVAAFVIWHLQGQSLSRFSWLGHLLITGAILLMLSRLEAHLQTEILILVLLNAISVVAMVILVERHPDNSATASPGIRLRFTGSVLLVTAGFFLAAKLLQGELTGKGWSEEVLFAGIAVGIFFRAPSMVLSFWSIQKIGSLNYTIAVSLLPFIGLAFEQMAVFFGWITASRLDISSFLLALGVLIGSLLVFLGRNKTPNIGAGGKAPNRH